MAMRTMNRLEQVHETVRAALNTLAAAAPTGILAGVLVVSAVKLARHTSPDT